MKKLPKWARRYTRKAQEALGLRAWIVEWVIDEQPNPDSPDADATTYADYPYLIATIKVKPGALDCDTSINRDAILHELLHVAAAGRDRTVERVIAAWVPEKHRELARGLIRDANEQYIVRLSRQLLPLVKPD